MLIQSQNYVWDIKDLLGVGATGAVYKGSHNLTGDFVAVKTFNSISKLRPMEVQMREFEVLKKIKHENIVKLIAIEAAINTNNNVIITELCIGGSLQKILCDPKNAYGLPQSDFILILKHLTAGLKYLHTNSIVHRDIKPDNIMKFISEDNQIIYKLADFGAARELETDNESFLSVYGTNEYLHPVLHERAIINPTINNGTKFTANYDLWSIGVTLYQIATSKLPFRPFAGRRNPQQMQNIISQKSNGIISAVQFNENGPIDYSTELPQNCLLGNSFKKLLTPLLSKLFEPKPEEMLKLEQYFEIVENILNKKICNIFFMNRLTLTDVFLNPNDRYEHLQAAIEAQTNVQIENQILLYANNYLLTKVGVNTDVKNYPNMDSENPIFLYSKDINVQISEHFEIPKFPKFNDTFSANDPNIAHMICGFSYIIQRKIDKYTTGNLLLNSGIGQLNETYKYLLTNLLRKINNFDELLTTVNGLLEADDNKDRILDELQFSIKKFKLLKIDFQNVTKQAESLFHKYVNENTLSQSWDTSRKDKNWPLQYRGLERTNTIIERLRSSWQKLVQDNEKDALTYEQAQFNTLEKNKMYENVKRLTSLINDNIEPSVKQMYNYFADWYKMAHIVNIQSDIINIDFIDINNKYRQIYENIYEIKNNKKYQEIQNHKIDQKEKQLWEKELKSNLITWSNMQNETENILKDNIEVNSELEKLKEKFQHI